MLPVPDGLEYPNTYKKYKKHTETQERNSTILGEGALNRTFRMVVCVKQCYLYRTRKITLGYTVGDQDNDLVGVEDIPCRRIDTISEHIGAKRRRVRGKLRARSPNCHACATELTIPSARHPTYCNITCRQDYCNTSRAALVN